MYLILLVGCVSNITLAEKNIKGDTLTDSLLAVSIDIPTKYIEVPLGEDLLSIINIINRMPDGRVDVLMSYDIKDRNDTKLISKSETVAIEGRSSFSRIFIIPRNTVPGDYTFNIKIQYNENSAIASQSFKVIEITKEEKNLVKILLIIGFIIF